ncbi:hypothetical protein LHT10_10120 [Lactococcus lactis]|uniref:hypothetical protein n=1 Tax=Lactococcus lactis TaxID=1358 RepID=UPI001F2D5AD5|nr:hypothetical protein [Lactococcus lactis]MCG1001491.1 hypothetical protein [Lactococcus lactis]
MKRFKGVNKKGKIVLILVGIIGFCIIAFLGLGIYRSNADRAHTDHLKYELESKKQSQAESISLSNSKAFKSAQSSYIKSSQSTSQSQSISESKAASASLSASQSEAAVQQAQKAAANQQAARDAQNPTQSAAATLDAQADATSGFLPNYRDDNTGVDLNYIDYQKLLKQAGFNNIVLKPTGIGDKGSDGEVYVTNQVMDRKISKDSEIDVFYSVYDAKLDVPLHDGPPPGEGVVQSTTKDPNSK